MCEVKLEVSFAAAEEKYEIRHHGIDPRQPPVSYAAYVLQLLSGIEDSANLRANPNPKRKADHSLKGR